MTKFTKNIIQFKKGFINLPKAKVLASSTNYDIAMLVVSELMQFGYILDQSAISILADSSKTEIVKFHDEIIEFLKESTGSKRNYTPFWKGFPTEVMEKSECELWLHQIVHYLSCGSYEPSEWTKQRPTAFEQPTYTKITSGDEDKFLSVFTDLVGANQSLTPDDMEIVKFFVENKIELIFPKVIPFKETLCVLSGMGLDVPVKTVTDVLRIAVYLSGGNTSLPKVPHKLIKLNRWSSDLSENPERDKFKFKKFSRGERKYLLSLLEKTNCDVKEFVLKDKRWLRLGEILHPGEFSKKYPKAFEMFDDIRNIKVKSWYGEVDDAFNKNFNTGLKKLSERPGEFMRRLDSLMRKDNEKHVKSVMPILDDMTLKSSNKVLYETYHHFKKRISAVQNRTIMAKGSRKRTKLPDLPGLSKNVVESIQMSVMTALQTKFTSLEKLGKVYIDEELKKLPIPSNMRSMGSTLRPVMRGQRVPIGNQNAKVIRAYVHWFDEHGTIDIDLTGSFIGMGKRAVVGWNGEHNSTIGCYSGDVRHRKGACAEYIDIDIANTRKAGFKYVLLDARNYNGGSLESIPECVFGYMEREYPESNMNFKPDTISNCIRLQSQKSTTLVVLIDVETYEYIFLDIDQDGIPVASANYDAILEALQPYMELPCFSVFDLLKMHANVRGEYIDTPEEADLILNVDSFPSYIEIAKWMGV